jgi:hypothetical protein
VAGRPLKSLEAAVDPKQPVAPAGDVSARIVRQLEQ